MERERKRVLFWFVGCAAVVTSTANEFFFERKSKMLFAKDKSAPNISTKRLSTANVTKSAVNLFRAFREIAKRWDFVSDIPPVFAVPPD